MTLLGKQSPTPEHYAPELLDPIPRADARAALGLDPESLPFAGEDVWHGWELAWLAPGGQPRVGVLRFVLPADSPKLVESKSFKLYLNSLNQTEFESETELVKTLSSDLGGVVGVEPGIEVLALDSPELAITALPGDCVDSLQIQAKAAAPSADLLQLQDSGGEGEQVLHSHSLRSLCPVTAQPDWASVIVRCTDSSLEPASLLAYIAAYSGHQEFHEQCVERMFCDLREAGVVGPLSVQALYTRRGGLDINPWRSSEPGPAPRFRTARQ